MGYILIGRHKRELDTWHDISGIYEYPNRKDFGNLTKIKRDNPDYDLMIIDKVKFEREYAK